MFVYGSLIYFVILIWLSVKIYKTDQPIKWYVPFWGGGFFCVSHILPALYFTLTYDSDIFYASASDFQYGLIIDLIFFIFWLVGYLVYYTFLNKKADRAVPDDISRQTLNTAKTMILVALTSLAVSFIFFSNTSFYGYYHIMKAIDKEAIRFWGILISPREYCYATLSVLCYFLLRQQPRHVQNKWLNIYLVAMMIFLAIEVFFLMQRSPILKIFGMVLAVFLFLGKKKRAIIFSIFIIILSSFIGVVVEWGRSARYTYETEDRIEILKLFPNNIENASTFLNSAIFQSIRRLDYASCAGIMARSTETSGYVTWRPYYSLLFVLVPRAIWPDKPIPNSIDGTQYGTATNIANSIRGGDELTSVAVGAGGVAYWEGGPAWLVLGGLVSGGLMAFITKNIYKKHGFWWMVLLLSVTGMSIDAIRSPSATMLNIMQKGSLLFFIYLLSRIIASLLEKIFVLNNRRTKLIRTQDSKEVEGKEKNT